MAENSGRGFKEFFARENFKGDFPNRLEYACVL